MTKRKGYNDKFEEIALNIERFNSISHSLSSMDRFESLLKSLSIATENINKMNFDSVSNSLLKFSNTLDSTLKMDRINQVYESFNNTVLKLNDISLKINISFCLNLINNYQKVINNYTQRDVFNENHLEYLNTIGKIYDNKIETMFYLKDIEGIAGLDFKLKEDLKSPESLIPKYYGYTFRNSSKESFQEEFENSDFDIISESGRKILKRMRDINTLYSNKNGEEFFKYNRETFELAGNIQQLAQDEQGFKSLMDLLYKGLYESSGAGTNRIIEMNLPHSQFIMKIKYFRNYFDHEHSNGPKKIPEVLNYTEKKIGKMLPDRQREWLRLQACIYKDLEIMLDEIYEYYNNNNSNNN